MDSLKSSSLVIATIGLGLVAVLGAQIEARSPSESPRSEVVIGEVSTVEGEFHMAKNAQGEDILEMVDKSYVITTRAGEEMRLELSDDTKVPKRANPGDRVEARISHEGHTLSVKRIE